VTRSNSKPTRKSTSPFLSMNPGVGESEEELRLLTPPPTPPLMARSGADYVPSPYKTATANPSPTSTLTKTPVRTQTHRKKEGGLEMRRPTRGPAAEKGKEKEPLRPLDLSSASSRQRQRDVTITQQSQQATRGPNPLRDPKKSNKNTDGHSSETCSTSGSSVSPLDGCTSGYCACSSHSSLDGPISTPPPPPFTLRSPHLVQHSDSNPPSPSPPQKPFNARKASTQCRAIQGYVSFASVEGLGEPPLIGNEFDADGFGEDGQGKGKGRKGAPFLPLGMWNAALGWKRFLGGAGIDHGEQPGVVL